MLSPISIGTIDLCPEAETGVTYLAIIPFVALPKPNPPCKVDVLDVLPVPFICLS
jgi:hypothetical protein